jgi:diaminohydroxyphosphoribosylaminopyrimidine deaminase/5-amino-6-(5-phosphoribosylamino)uracil reductase
MTTADPTTDTRWMRLALERAKASIGVSDPNPRVSCVIVAADGRELARGHTQQAGGPHAEIVAMRAARAAGHALHGATAFVTLEPCSHHGRTPPCCDALIEAGIGRVVVAVGDPNPLVAGNGVARLRAAGIAVEIGLLADEARALNVGFFSRMLRGLPWVRMKIAASIDGRTALLNGASQWITGETARIDGHRWRQRAGALLTGVGTVLDDNPRLDVRLVPSTLQPLRVIVDSALATPPTARILDAPGRVLIYAADAPTERAAALRSRGAEIVVLPNAAGKVDLAAMLRDLAVREINELHVEAGEKLNGSFIREGLVDEFLLYLAPKMLGPGRGLAALSPLERLDDAVALRFDSVEQVGDDLRVTARPAHRA